MPAPDSRRAFHLQSLGPLSALQVTLRSRFGNKSISPCAGSVDAISIGRIRAGGRNADGGLQLRTVVEEHQNR